MKISKEYRWEMGHRLPDHDGLCRNIHGHSYKMIVELDGEVAANGMIIDFYDLGKIVKPVIEKLDHCFLVFKDDKKVLSFLKENGMKYEVTDYPATVENIAFDICKILSEGIKAQKFNNVKSLSVKIFETPNSSAEVKIDL